jgi:elongation factor 1-alpha
MDETKNHPLLAYTMGVKKVIVCVTHMDHPDVYFAQSSYDAAKELVALPLKRVGFNVAQTHFIPISAITGLTPAPARTHLHLLTLKNQTQVKMCLPSRQR